MQMSTRNNPPQVSLRYWYCSCDTGMPLPSMPDCFEYWVMCCDCFLQVFRIAQDITSLSSSLPLDLSSAIFVRTVSAQGPQMQRPAATCPFWAFSLLPCTLSLALPLTFCLLVGWWEIDADASADYWVGCSTASDCCMMCHWLGTVWKRVLKVTVRDNDVMMCVTGLKEHRILEAAFSLIFSSRPVTPRCHLWSIFRWEIWLSRTPPLGPCSDLDLSWLCHWEVLH